MWSLVSFQSQKLDVKLIPSFLRLPGFRTSFLHVSTLKGSFELARFESSRLSFLLYILIFSKSRTPAELIVSCTHSLHGYPLSSAPF